MNKMSRIHYTKDELADMVLEYEMSNVDLLINEAIAADSYIEDEDYDSFCHRDEFNSDDLNNF